MNVKILVDSKSTVSYKQSHSTSRPTIKCFPRYIPMPLDLGCQLFWSGLTGRMTKMSTWLSLAPCGYTTFPSSSRPVVDRGDGTARRRREQRELRPAELLMLMAGMELPSCPARAGAAGPPARSWSSVVEAAGGGRMAQSA